MENTLTDTWSLSFTVAKCCNTLKKFDRLKFDGLAEKRKNIKIFLVKILRYTIF